jgi:hypothetical protein
MIEIAVEVERDEEGNAWAKDGFRRSDGTTGRSWDWWSLAGELTEREGGGGTSKGEPSVYAWGPLEKGSPVEGGVFMFMHDGDGGLGLVSIVPIKESLSDDGSEGSMLGLPFTVERDGSRLRWKAVQGDAEILTSAVLDNGDIVGVTRMVREGKDESRYSWAAKPVSGPAL